MRRMNHAAFWVLGGSMLSGVCMGLVYGSDWWLVGWLWFLAAMIAVSARFFAPSTFSILIAVGCIGIGIGVARAHLSPPPYSAVLSSFVADPVYVEGVVTAEPDIRETSVLITITPSRIGIAEDEMQDVSDSVRILASMRGSRGVSYGDRVRVYGELVYPERFETDTGRSFNYPGFLSVRGIGYRMVDADIVVLGSGEGWWIVSVLSSIRGAYLNGLKQSLVEPHAALAGGITVGDKRALGGDLTETFQVVGLSHIVVLSGYNITIVSDVVMRALGALSQVAAASVGGVIIMLFVIMSGASAAAVRAGIMACVVLFARIVRRPAQATRALMIAIIVMVMYEPRILLYDPGFQLSVIATLGLVYIAPLISQRLGWVTERFEIREIIAATVGTQIAVAPLLLYQTGLFSLVSLPVNVLVLPLVPAAMFASFIGGLVGIFSHIGGMIVGAPAYIVLEYVLIVAESAARLPGAALITPSIPLTGVAGMYALLVGGVWYITLREQRKSVPQPPSS